MLVFFDDICIMTTSKLNTKDKQMTNTTISYTELEDQVNNGDFDTEYAEYIMDNCGGDRIIGNGDALICAMEGGYLIDSFVESLYDKLTTGASI